MTTLAEDPPKPIQPPSRMANIAKSNASGATANGMIVVFLMFALGRMYGSKEAIPHDVLEIAPYLVVIIGGAVHFVSELVMRNRYVRKLAEVAGQDPI